MFYDVHKYDFFFLYFKLFINIFSYNFGYNKICLRIDTIMLRLFWHKMFSVGKDGERERERSCAVLSVKEKMRRSTVSDFRVESI